MTVKKNLIEQNEIEYKMGKNNLNVEIFEKFSSYSMQIFPNNFFVFKDVKFRDVGVTIFSNQETFNLVHLRKGNQQLIYIMILKKCIR